MNGWNGATPPMGPGNIIGGAIEEGTPNPPLDGKSPCPWKPTGGGTGCEIPRSCSTAVGSTLPDKKFSASLRTSGMGLSCYRLKSRNLFIERNTSSGDMRSVPHDGHLRLFPRSSWRTNASLTI